MRCRLVSLRQIALAAASVLALTATGCGGPAAAPTCSKPSDCPTAGQDCVNGLCVTPGGDVNGVVLDGSLAKESPAGHYVIEVPDGISPQLLASVTAWCAERGVLPTSLRIVSRTLEDVFLELTGKELRP